MGASVVTEPLLSGPVGSSSTESRSPRYSVLHWFLQLPARWMDGWMERARAGAPYTASKFDHFLLHPYVCLYICVCEHQSRTRNDQKGVMKLTKCLLLWPSFPFPNWFARCSTGNRIEQHQHSSVLGPPTGTTKIANQTTVQLSEFLRTPEQPNCRSGCRCAGCHPFCCTQGIKPASRPAGWK